MKKTAIVLLGVLMLPTFLMAQKTTQLNSEKDSLAYAYGILIFENVQELDSEMDIKMIMKGWQEAKEKKALLSPDDAMRCLQDFARREQEMAARKTANEGKTFLEENKKKEGVVVTFSGLQYKVKKMGTGPRPTATDRVKVHYTGKLIDGTVFDSSVDRGEPAVFGLNQVISGWTEALQLMPVGSEWTVYLPSELAYGDRGAGQDIKPGATLIFEISLLDIVTE